jgi:hypothetical protein
VLRRAVPDEPRGRVGDYNLPSSALAFKSLWVSPASGQTADLTRASSADIISRRRYAAVAVAPYLYSLEGANLLMLYPDAQSASDLLEGIYVPRPTKMSGAADDPSVAGFGGVPEEFHPALEEYVKWQAADWDDDTSSKVGQRYQENWDKAVLAAKVDLNKKLGVRWGPARLGRRDRVPTTPGTDIG